MPLLPRTTIEMTPRRLSRRRGRSATSRRPSRRPRRLHRRLGLVSKLDRRLALADLSDTSNQNRARRAPGSRSVTPSCWPPFPPTAGQALETIIAASP